jgi:hypothetical protein
VPSPSPAGIGEQTHSTLGAVAIDSPNDAWAVGDWSPASTDPRKIPPSHGLIEHWNGAKWTVVPGPSSGGRTTNLTEVAAISPTAAWAIGGGTIGARASTVFMRWNGTRWRYLPSPAGTLLSGLAAISAHDIWVVGTKLTPKSKPAERTLAEHWNGSKWTIVPTPNAFKGRTRKSSLHAVGGSSSSNVWAAGWYQSGPTGLDLSTLVEHWNGARWQVQPSPDGPAATGESQLFATAALSRTSAWAVGGYDSSHGLVPLIEHRNSARWTTLPSKLQPGVHGAFLSGVAVVDPHYAWAVGEALQQNHPPITLIENGTAPAGSRYQARIREIASACAQVARVRSPPRR